jgi:hypothetical protein
MAAAR